jgi:hypothetical protein
MLKICGGTEVFKIRIWKEILEICNENKILKSFVLEL